jgi:hypothetical protein
MDVEVPCTFGDADVVLIALDGDVLAVLGGADSVQQGAEIDVVEVSIVDADLAGLEVFMVEGGKNPGSHFNRHIDAYGLALVLLVFDADMDPLVGIRGSLCERGEREESAGREYQRTGKAEETPRKMVHG